MKNYYRVMLGKGSIYAEECFAGNFIGTDFGIAQDLTRNLPEEWRAFNREFIPIYLANHPDKTKIGAGWACGALWPFSKGIRRAIFCSALMAADAIAWVRSPATTT